MKKLNKQVQEQLNSNLIESVFYSPMMYQRRARHSESSPAASCFNKSRPQHLEWPCLLGAAWFVLPEQ